MFLKTHGSHLKPTFLQSIRQFLRVFYSCNHLINSCSSTVILNESLVLSYMWECHIVARVVYFYTFVSDIMKIKYNVLLYMIFQFEN